MSDYTGSSADWAPLGLYLNLSRNLRLNLYLYYDDAAMEIDYALL